MRVSCSVFTYSSGWVEATVYTAARSAAGAGRARPGRVAGAAPHAGPRGVRRLANAPADLGSAARVEIAAAARALRAVARGAHRHVAGVRRLGRHASRADRV